MSEKKIIDLDSLREDIEYKHGQMADKIDKSFNIFRDGDAQNDTFGIWNTDVNYTVNNDVLKNIALTEAWAFIAIDLIAQKISSQEMVVMQRKVVDGEEVIEPDMDHDLNKLISKPNQFQDYHSFMYQSVFDLMSGGNDITAFFRNKRELMILPFERVGLNIEGDCTIKQYFFEPNGTTCDVPGKREGVLAFDPKQIIHVKKPNPKSLIWGFSPMVPGLKALLFDRYTADYLNNFYLKQATPAMAIEMEDTVNEDVAMRLLRAFETAHTGRRNQRRTMLLPKGMSVTPLSHSIADQHIMELIEKNRETMINIWKIPKHELGLQDAGSLGSEEHKTALRNFWEATLIPCMNMISGEYTRYFSKELGEDRFFEFDLHDVAALQEDKVKQADLATQLLSTHTINEVRQTLYNLPPIEGGDVVLEIARLEAGTLGLPPIASDEKPQSEVQEPEAPQEQLPEESEDDKAEKQIARQRAIQENFLKRNAGKVADVEKQLGELMDAREPEIFQAAVGLFISTAENAVDVVQNTLRETRSAAKRVKAEIPNRQQLRQRLRRAFEEAGDKFKEDSREPLVGAVESGYDTQLSFGFNVQNQAEIDALREREADVRERRLISTLEGRTDKITDTNIKRAMDLITEGVKNNNTLDEISQSLLGAFADVENIRGRANMISRTETLTAVSLGQQAASENVAEVVPGVQKMWLNSNDLRVRGNPAGEYADSKSDHWNLGGQVVDVDEKFTDPRSGAQLKMPRDPQGGPGDVINCRCTQILVSPEDVEDTLDLLSQQ